MGHRFLWTVTLVVVVVVLVGTLPAPLSLAASSKTAANVTNTPATVLDAWSTTNHDIFASASCSSPGNCAAVGYSFTYAPGVASQAIVVGEINGHWGKVTLLDPDLTPANRGSLSSVSCESAGNCVAVGSYIAGVGSSAYESPLLATETNGVWDNGVMPSENGFLTAVSCSSSGNCTAVGFIGNSTASITMTGGVWGPVVDVPVTNGQGTPITGLVFTSIDCPAPLQCAAVGGFEPGDTTGFGDPSFVASLVDGTWTAQGEVGAALTPAGHSSSLLSVACSSVGNCAAVGYADYKPNVFTPDPIPMGVTETNGVWGQGVELAHALNTKHWGELGGISCVPNGKCVAAGYYYGNSKFWTELGVSETNGSWSAGSAIAPVVSEAYPGNETWEVSCVTSGQCFARLILSHRSNMYTPLITIRCWPNWLGRSGSVRP